MTGKMIGHSAGMPSACIDRGIGFNITMDYQKIIYTVPAGSFWVPIISSCNPGKYVPLFPFASATSSTTTITASATELALFDPAGSDVNDYWLTANDGGQTVTYWDTSADGTLYGETLGTGAIYSESQILSSVTTTSGTLGTTFTADMGSGDVLLPGGIDENTHILDNAVWVEDEINVAEINLYGSSWGAIRSARMNAVIKYDNLSAANRTLIGYGIIPMTGNRNFTIIRD